jgi:hypothetical protein
MARFEFESEMFLFSFSSLVLLQRRRSSPRCARPRPQAPPARVLVAERARIFPSRSAVRRFPVSSSRSAPPPDFLAGR